MSPQKRLFSEILGIEHRWPERGDRLFGVSENAAANAALAPVALFREYFMAIGYKGAADILVDAAISDDLVRHALVYPVVFSYRQFIELSLKAQIRTFGESVGVSQPGNIHDLKKLLRDFRRMCRNYTGEDSETVTAVSKCILEFVRIDPASFHFRYPTGKDGNVYPIKVDEIDLERLKDVMGGVSNFFEANRTYLQELTANDPTP